MDKKEIKKYDKRGNLIYYKCLDGLESWSKYNENNNEINFKHSDVFEYASETLRGDKTWPSKMTDFLPLSRLQKLPLRDCSFLKRK